MLKGLRVNTGNRGGLAGPGSTTFSLLEQVKANDPAAWQRLVVLYGPLVYSWARQAGLQAEDAADVVQEVFRAVLTHVGDFRLDRRDASFRGWLRTITQNKLHDYWRRQGAQPEARGGSDAQQWLMQVPAADSTSSATTSDPNEIGPLLNRALDLIHLEFEERSWQAFLRVTVQGQRPADVAADLAMSVNAVYVARSRILHRLREELGE